MHRPVTPGTVRRRQWRLVTRKWTYLHRTGRRPVSAEFARLVTSEWEHRPDDPGGRAAPQVLPAHRRRRPGSPARTRPCLRSGPARRTWHGPASAREGAVTRPPAGQRSAERLISRACRRLPVGTRDERYRESAAELPAILHDPSIRFPLLGRPRPARSATPSAPTEAPATCAGSLPIPPAHHAGRPSCEHRCRPSGPCSRCILPRWPGSGPAARCWPASPTVPAASIFLAQEEARRLGHDRIDPEHILLGLIPRG